MRSWDIYRARIENQGVTEREAVKRREMMTITNKLRNSLSYFNCLVDEEPRDVAIINSDNLNEKTILSMPGEDIRCGAMVYWMDNHWMVTEKDANNELYTKGKLLQCNYLLKWIDPDTREIHEQWCCVEDSTKYLTGLLEDRHYILKDGDARVSMIISKNEWTIKFNRQSRFLFDDPDATTWLAFDLTKPLRVGKTYNGDGVLQFVLSEGKTTEFDNLDLGIPNYYKYFNKMGNPINTDIPLPLEVREREVWI